MKKKKNFCQRNTVRKQDEVPQNAPQQNKKKKIKTLNQKETQENGLVLFCGRRTVEQLYSKGPAVFESSKRLQKHSKESLAKNKSDLDIKPSFTKYRSIRISHT